MAVVIVSIGYISCVDANYWMIADSKEGCYLSKDPRICYALHNLRQSTDRIADEIAKLRETIVATQSSAEVVSVKMPDTREFSDMCRMSEKCK